MKYRLVVKLITVSSFLCLTAAVWTATNITIAEKLVLVVLGYVAIGLEIWEGT